MQECGFQTTLECNRYAIPGAKLLAQSPLTPFLRSHDMSARVGDSTASRIKRKYLDEALR